MKKIILIVLASLLVFSCQSTKKNQVSSPKPKTISNINEVLLPEPYDDDFSSLSDEQKVTKVVDLSEYNPKQALELALTINVNNLSDDAKLTYRRIEKEFMLIRTGKKKLGSGYSNVSALATDKEDLWIGDLQGGFARYNIASEDLFVVRKTRPSSQVRSVNAILVEEKEVWAAASDTVICYDKKTSKSENINLPTSSYAWDLVRYQSKLLIATQGSGIYALTSDRNWKKAVFSDSRLKSVNKLAVIEDILFAGTSSGFWYYNGDEWNSIKELEGLNILALKVYGSEIYIGTDKDLYLIKRDASIKKFNLKQDFIHTLTIIDNYLIAGSLEKGMARINMETKEVESENISDKSPILLRIGSLTSFSPYLVVGTMGNSIVLMHQKLYAQ